MNRGGHQAKTRGRNAGLTKLPLVVPPSRTFWPEDFVPEIELLEELPSRWAIVGSMAAII